MIYSLRRGLWSLFLLLGLTGASWAASLQPLAPEPDVPVLLSPANGAQNLPVANTLTWRSAALATGYEVQISASPTFSGASTISRTDTFWTTPSLADGFTYYWRVRATNTFGASAWTTGWSYTTAALLAPPISATLVSPANNSGTVPSNATFLWRALPTATSYELDYATNANFQGPSLVTTAVTDTTLTVSGLTQGTTYFWRVRGINAAGNGVYSLVWQFTVAAPNQPPAQVVLVAPAQGANVTTSPTLQWRPAARAVTYQVEVALNGQFNLGLQTSIVSDTFLVLGGLAPSTNYFWRVRGTNTAGNGTVSQTRIFTTANIPTPNAPVQFLPANNSINQPVNLTFGWNSVPTATGYTIEYSLNSNLSAAISTTVTDTLYSVSGLQAGSTYFWRVRTVAGTILSAWSGTWNFTTQTAAGALLPPTLRLPVDSAKNRPVVDSLVFLPVAGATGYQIQLSNSNSFSAVSPVSVSDTFYITPTLAYSTMYYWRARTINGQGPGNWSQTRLFVTTNPPPAPGAPTLVSPPDASTGQPLSPTLTWNRVGGATNYTLQYALNPNFLGGQTLTVTDTFTTVGPLIAGNTYFWHVRANNAGGNSAYSAAWTFQTDNSLQPPGQAALIFPIANATNVSLSPLLTWNRAVRATSYQIQVSLQATFANPITYTSTDTTVRVYALASATQYFWRVRGINSFGAGQWTNPPARSFTTLRGSLPNIPTLLTPTDYATNQPLTVSLVWKGDATATSFVLEYGTDSTFAVKTRVTTTDSSYAVNGLLGNTRYFWRVYAENANGMTLWSLIYAFNTTALPVPATPQLVSPADASINLPTTVDLVWRSQSDATGYTAQYSVNANFTGAQQVNLTDTTTQISRLIANTTYFWRVRATNADGNSAWTNAWRFTVAPLAGTPDAPNLISPANNSTNGPLVSTLTWNRVNGSSGFELQVSTNALFTGATTVTVSDTFYVTTPQAYSTIYYWRVRAVNQIGSGNWSTAWQYTTVSPPPAPGAPTLISPANGATNVAVPVTFLWHKLATATSYQLQYAQNPNFLGGNTVNVNDTTTTVAGLQAGSTYFWRVRGINQTGNGTYSTGWQFSTAGNSIPPGQVTLLTPANNALGVSVTPTLLWRTGLRASSYEVEYATNFTMTGAIRLTTTDTTATLPVLAANTLYYWRVRGVNNVGNGQWQQRPNQFTTGAYPTPTAPKLLSPADSAVNLPIDLTLTLAKVAVATSYIIQYDTDSTFATAQSTSTVDTTWDITGLSYNTRYFWRAAAINTTGISPWSTIWRFRTEVAGSVAARTRAELVLYPNPATDQVQVKGLTKDTPYRVINTLGQVLMQGSMPAQQALPLALPAGTYQLLLQHEDGLQRLPLVIQR